jgi:hypothetical protein
MLRMGFGLALIFCTVAAQAALAEEGFFAPKLNLLTIQPIDAIFRPYYQFSASVVLVRSPDASVTGNEASGNAQYLPIARTQQEAKQTLIPHWNQSYESDRISPPLKLRLEFKVEQLNIVMRPNSFSIDEDRVKVVLHSHSASIMWRKPF